MPEEALPAASESPPLEEVIADGELLRQVHRIIHKMDEPYKEVFTLKVFGDLSFKDISSLFGKTESWARVT
jgi:RNA polymerase sigma-70 factor (ECF subfamily)